MESLEPDNQAKWAQWAFEHYPALLARVTQLHRQYRSGNTLAGHTKDISVADDCHDTLIKLIKENRELPESDAMSDSARKGYFYRSVQNHMNSRIRQSKRRGLQQMDTAIKDGLAKHSGAADHMNRLADDEDLLLIQAAIFTKLEADEEAVVMGVLYFNRDRKDVFEELGMCKSTGSDILKRARKKMAIYTEEHHGESRG